MLSNSYIETMQIKFFNASTYTKQKIDAKICSNFYNQLVKSECMHFYE